MTRKNIPAIIFYGAIWGIIEASIGYLLHMLPISIFISGTVLFPLVSYILYRAYKTTDSKSALLAIGIIAASIKAFDFFLPFNSPFKIVNPMISIVMEAMVVLFVITLIDKDDLTAKIKAFLIASVGWRILYLSYNAGQYLTSGFVSDYIANGLAIFLFVIVYGLISAVLAIIMHYGGLKVTQSLRITHVRPMKLSISIMVLLIAIILTLLV